MSAFSLYVHIPWCRSKCPYCDFNSHAAQLWPERRYTDALLSEWRLRINQPSWHGKSVATLFFGGGTPSLFDPLSIERILDAVERDTGFSPNAEITLEANPGTITAERLRDFRRAGINRISFGIQSFDARFLKLLGRLHTYTDTREAAPLARAAGFDNLSLDLIFALPGQTLDDWIKDLNTVIDCAPDHISAYNLTYEEGTAFYDLRAEKRLKPLDEDVEADMFELTREKLAGAGYHAYEISNFAHPGRESRHNLTYWRAEPYLGLGAGAHSWYLIDQRGHRWANEKDPARYMDLVLEKGFATTSEEAVSPQQSAGEFVFLNLRRTEGFGEERFHERFGSPFRQLFPQAEDLFTNNMIEEADGRIRLSKRGLLLADAVFAEFMISETEPLEVT